MKATTDYIIGNTAIQIVHKGNRVRIIDVEKAEKKKCFLKHMSAVCLIGSILLFCCFYTVKLQNTKVLLDKQVYALQGQIEEMQRENTVLAKEMEKDTTDYKKILRKARAWGMDFPANDQIYHYHLQKSTVVKMK